MKLPNHEAAVVPRAKIVDYLLSRTHRDGKPKADFFTRFGFRVEQWEILAEALLEHARSNEVNESQISPFGMRYIIVGELAAPDGRRPLVLSIWFIEHEDEKPRLVSAYPARRTRP